MLKKRGKIKRENKQTNKNNVKKKKRNKESKQTNKNNVAKIIKKIQVQN